MVYIPFIAINRVKHIWVGFGWGGSDLHQPDVTITVGFRSIINRRKIEKIFITGVINMKQKFNPILSHCLQMNMSDHVLLDQF